jgi:hypothetical protein
MINTWFISDTHFGHKNIIVLNHFGQRCGYVAIPSKNKCNKEVNYEMDIKCHGGITFIGDDHNLKNLLNNPCQDNWIGFDCGHYGDSSDFEALNKYFDDNFISESMKKCLELCSEGGIVRDFQYAEKQCKSIIDQLIEME